MWGSPRGKVSSERVELALYGCPLDFDDLIADPESAVVSEHIVSAAPNSIFTVRSDNSNFTVTGMIV